MVLVTQLPEGSLTLQSFYLTLSAANSGVRNCPSGSRTQCLAVCRPIRGGEFMVHWLVLVLHVYHGLSRDDWIMRRRRLCRT